MAASELRTRVITGLVFGLVLIGGTLLSEYILLGITLFIASMGLFELRRLSRPLGIEPGAFLFFLGGLSVFAAVMGFTLAHVSAGIRMEDVKNAVVAFLVFSLLLFLVELFRAKQKALENISITYLGLFYIALPSGLLLVSTVDSLGNYQPWRLLIFFFMMWASDTGAYFTGKYFGKRKLLERLSPKKTIEGFLGGMLTAMLVGFITFQILQTGSVLGWVATGALMAITGTAGDLFESMLKRQAGIKDSGSILPGHGGILDRFDSTFISIPVYWLMISYLF